MTNKDWVIVLLLIAAILCCNLRRLRFAIGIGTNGNGTGSGSGSGRAAGGCCGGGCSGCSYGDDTAGNPVSTALGIGNYGQAGLQAGFEPNSMYEYESMPHWGTTVPISGPAGDYTQNEGGDGVWP